MKKNLNEEQMWAAFYSAACAFLTLGNSIKSLGVTDERFAEMVDGRAAAIADKAVKRLKGKLP
jgi:hypothetical protein